MSSLDAIQKIKRDESWAGWCETHGGKKKRKSEKLGQTYPRNCTSGPFPRKKKAESNILFYGISVPQTHAVARLGPGALSQALRLAPRHIVGRRQRAAPVDLRPREKSPPKKTLLTNKTPSFGTREIPFKTPSHRGSFCSTE